MDRNLAIKYVTFGSEKVKIKKKSSYKLLILNILLFLVAAIPYSNNILVLLCVIILVLNILTTVCLFFKKSLFLNYLVFSIGLLFSILAINLIYYSISTYMNFFNIYDYIISIVIQMLMIIPSIFLIKIGKKVIVNDKVPMSYLYIESIYITSTMVGYFIAKHFLTDFLKDFGIVTFLVAINIISFALILIICGFIYKAYLIKKYRINDI